MPKFPKTIYAQWTDEDEPFLVCDKDIAVLDLGDEPSEIAVYELKDTRRVKLEVRDTGDC